MFASKGFFIFLISCIIAGSTLANPTGGVVSSGDATITQSANQTTIQQSSQTAIINWQSFNIGTNEKTQFQQPQGGIALNRISATQGPSQIYGQLTATGKIILVNQAGVFFGPGSYVNVGGIIASASDISDQNFLAGKLIFDQPSPFNGAVINKGTMIAATNGLVALIGNNVRNDGMIQAESGNVVLASGNKFTVDLYGDQLINFTVDEGITGAGTDENGNALTDAVNNNGTIIANGGQILLTAKAASGVIDNVINMSGVAQAHSVGQQNGAIILSSDAPEPVIVSGLLDASGKGKGQTGGTVKVLGKKVGLFDNAKIDVTGDQGGGTALIGGNAHGAGPEQDADYTYISPNAIIDASASTSGNGGTAVVWSNQGTQFYGNIFAKGGTQSGSGGWVETSGGNIVFQGDVDTSAAHGVTGSLLLDPTTLFIVNGNAGTGSQDNNLISSSGIILFTTPNTGSGNNTNTISVGQLAGMNNTNFLLQATNTLTIGDSLGNSATVNLPNLNSATLTLQAGDSTTVGGGNIIFNPGSSITTAGGGVTIIAGDGTTQTGSAILGAISTGGGAISVTAQQGVTLNGAISSSSGYQIYHVNQGGSGANNFTIASGGSISASSASSVSVTVNTNSGGSGGIALDNSAGANITTSFSNLLLRTDGGGTSNTTGGSITQVSGASINSSADPIILAVPSASSSSIGTSAIPIAITGTGAITLSGVGSGGVFITNTGSFPLSAPSNVNANAPFQIISSGVLTLPNYAFSTGTGNIEFASIGGALATLNTLTTSSGNVTLFAGGTGALTIGNTITTTSGSAVFTSGTGNIQLNANVTTGGDQTYNSPLVIGAADNITTTTLSIVDLTLNNTLTITNSNLGNITGMISGSGGLNANGSSILTLSNNSNNYSGTTNISNGILQIGAGGSTGALGSGDVILNNGTLQFNLTVPYDVTNNISGGSSSVYAVTQNGTGALTFTGHNTYSGTTRIGTDAGGNGGVVAGSYDGISSSLSPNSSYYVYNGILDVSQYTETTGLVFGNGNGGILDLGHNTLTMNVTLSDQFLGKIEGFSDSNIILNAASPQTWHLFNNADLSNFTGTLTINNNMTVNSDFSAPSTKIIVNSGGVLGVDAGGALAIASLANNLNSAGSVLINSGGTLTIGSTTGTNPNLNSSFSGVISGTTGNLIKGGSGTLTLSGANTYGGSTTVDAGTLKSGAADALSINSAIRLLSGTTLDLNGLSQDILSLAGAGNVTSSAAGNATLSVNDSSGSNFVYSGAISNGAGIVSYEKNGTSTQTFSGTNTYSGLTNIAEGILNITNVNALGSSDVTVAAGSELTINSSLGTISNALNIAGSGNGDGGALVNAGTNTFSGVITLYDNAAISSSGTLNITGGIDGPYNLTLAGSGTINLQGAVIGPNIKTLTSTVATLGIDTNIATQQLQTYVSNVVLYMTPSFDSGGNGIVFDGSVSANTGAEGLSFPDNFGGVTFNGSVGAGTPLASLSVGASDPVSLGQLGQISINTNGSQTYNSTITLYHNTSLATNADITLNNIVGNNNILSLAGGAGNNTFTFKGSVSVINSLTVAGGNTQANKLDFSNLTSLALNELNVILTATGSNHGFSGSSNYGNMTFDNIDTINGSSSVSSTLTGTNNANTWLISAVNAGTFTDTNNLNFSNFKNISGGANANTFTIANGASVTGNINGGTSNANQLNFMDAVKLLLTSIDSGSAKITSNGANVVSSFNKIKQATAVGPTGHLYIPTGKTFKVSYTNAKKTNGTIADPFVFTNFIVVLPQLTPTNIGNAIVPTIPSSDNFFPGSGDNSVAVDTSSLNQLYQDIALDDLEAQQLITFGCFFAN